ncbi:hypothetical protein CASFOL_008229 [Castilleja foliolosa]|uniref:Ubiquitin-like protease family profile domain-containing protein n=1 Tax=Castilleja foliolosa TaxID=1961234 RepID=A0ABD3E2E6_9LAMI
MESELNSIVAGIIADVAHDSGATVVSNPSSTDLALVDYETYVGSIGDSYLRLFDEEEVNAEPELWSWKRPSFQGKTAAITGYVRMKDFADVRSQLKKNPEAYQKFKDSCFGRYLEYCKDKNTNCPNAVLHAMLGQQVKRVDVSEPDALWFRVKNTFLRFSKYEYALVTGLRFGPTDFDPKVKYEYPAGGVFKRRNGDETKMVTYKDLLPLFLSGHFHDSVYDELKIAKLLFVCGFLLGLDLWGSKAIPKWLWVLVEDEDKWESFPWGSYTFQILYSKIELVSDEQPVEANKKFAYHFYGNSHAFVHWVFEALPSLAEYLNISENKSPEAQRPRLLKWPLPSYSKNVVEFFDNQTPVECNDELKPTVEEENAYPWLIYLSDDVQTHVKHTARGSVVSTPKTSVRRRARTDHMLALSEESPRSPRRDSSQHLFEHNTRPEKRARKESNIHSPDSVVRSLSEIKIDNDNLLEKFVQENANNNAEMKRISEDALEKLWHENAKTVSTLKEERGDLSVEVIRREFQVLLKDAVDRLTQKNEALQDSWRQEYRAFLKEAVETLYGAVSNGSGQPISSTGTMVVKLPSPSGNVPLSPQPSSDDQSAQLRQQPESFVVPSSPPPSSDDQSAQLRQQTESFVSPSSPPPSSDDQSAQLPQQSESVIIPVSTQPPSDQSAQLPQQSDSVIVSVSPQPPLDLLALFPRQSPPTDPIPFVPFNEAFMEQLEAYTDCVYKKSCKAIVPYVLCRRKNEPAMTPIGIRLPKISPLRPIFVEAHELIRLIVPEVIETCPKPPTIPNVNSTSSLIRDDVLMEYNKFMDSDDQTVRIGLYDVGPSFFRTCENPEADSEEDALDAYLQILHNHPEFIGVRRNNEERFTVVGILFTQICENLTEGENNKRTSASCLSKEQIPDTLLEIVRGVGVGETNPGWNKMVPWSDIDRVYTIWHDIDHWYPIAIDLVTCEIWIFDSLFHNAELPDLRYRRYKGTRKLRRLLPDLLKHSGIFETRATIDREWDLRFAHPDHCFNQTDNHACGIFSLKMIEVLMSRQAQANIDEGHILEIRKFIAERTYTYFKHRLLYESK